MAKIIYPPHLARRVLALEAPGGKAAAVSLVVPTITVPGEPFTVKVAVLDELGYPSTEFDGAVKLRGPLAGAGEIEVPFVRGLPAVAHVAGVVIAAEGLYRFQADCDGRASHSNPTRCTSGPASRIYWGDPHVHTVLSDCHPDRCRSVEFCYVAGKWLSGLEWVSAADHVSNGRGSLGKWRQQAATSELFDEPGVFATLPAYEASLKGGAGGDNNVYMLRWPDIFVDEYDQGNVGTLCEKMSANLLPEEFFVVPHHTTRTGKHGEISDDIYPGPEWMPVIEIHSKWGTSEYRGNPNGLHEIHPGPSYAVDLLGRGLRLGFIGGTDTHTTLPAGHDRGNPGHINRPPGMTAVRARELTREAVFGGIRGRNCYAASGERIYLEADVAGARPGQSIEWTDSKAPRCISVTAAAAGDIASVEIIRNGQAIHTQQGLSWKMAFDFTDADDLADSALASKDPGGLAYYYVRLTCRSGAQAWSSPVWLSIG